MQLDERDAGYLWDMLDAANNIMDFTKGVTGAQYLQDRKLQLAVERSLEIIGEAAKSISDVCQKAYPEIPWRRIIGQRNVIAHEYGEIRQERIWELAQTNIPELVQTLKRLLPKNPQA